MTPSYAEISLDYFQNERQSLQFYMLLMLLYCSFPHITGELLCSFSCKRTVICHAELSLSLLPFSQEDHCKGLEQ